MTTIIAVPGRPAGHSFDEGRMGVARTGSVIMPQGSAVAAGAVPWCELPSRGGVNPTPFPGVGLLAGDGGYGLASLSMQLVREHGSLGTGAPRTWLAVLHHLTGLVIGAVSFPIVLAGVTVGAALAPIGGSACRSSA